MMKLSKNVAASGVAIQEDGPMMAVKIEKKLLFSERKIRVLSKPIF
jgi:hypothetical protein